LPKMLKIVFKDLARFCNKFIFWFLKILVDPKRSNYLLA